MKTPNHLTDAEINALVETGRPPMSEHGKLLFDLGRALLGAITPEAMFARPTIDLRRRAYDIDVRECLWAPRSERWEARDMNTFDGAPDSEGISTFVGHGPTPQAARMDLLEQFAEHDNEPDLFDEEAADRAYYAPIGGTAAHREEPPDYRRVSRTDCDEDERHDD